MSHMATALGVRDDAAFQAAYWKVFEGFFGRQNAAVVKAGDLLFLLNDDGELIVARASRSRFEPIVRYIVADSATWAQPTISGNRIFIKDVTSLSLWTFD